MFPHEYQQTGDRPGASSLRREGPVCSICLLPPYEYVCHNWLQMVLVKIPNSAGERGTQRFHKAVAWCDLPRNAEFLQVLRNQFPRLQCTFARFVLL